MDISSLLAFTKEVDRLKSVQRKSLVYTGERLENSAEHSWHLAISVMAFYPYVSKKVNLLEALRMAILHDVVEIDGGDTFLYGDNSKKAGEEEACAQRIFGMLPESAEWLGLWRRFEAKECPESQFVGALDRFLPVYSNLLNKGHAWRENGVTLEQVKAKSGPAISSIFPELWEYLEKLLAKAVELGHLSWA
ncbi:MAG: HD domain-containing protein [Bdellovibrionota bacterium]